jgi:hypothetical protein
LWVLAKGPVLLASVANDGKRLTSSLSDFSRTNVNRQPVISLPLRLTARQLLYLRFFRTTRIVTRFQRLFRFALFACGAFSFLAIFFAEFACICHERMYLSSFSYLLLLTVCQSLPLR